MLEQLEVLKYYLYYRYILPKGRCFRSRKALRRRQGRRLRRHLRYVSEHSPLYRGMRKLSSYPVIDKAFMMEHFDRLNTVGIRREEAEAFAVQAERERDFAPKLRGVTVGLSSGTSGHRGIFLVSDKEKGGQVMCWQNSCREASWNPWTLPFSCVRTATSIRR